MSDEVRWWIVKIIVYIAALLTLAWVISFAIRSSLKYREEHAPQTPPPLPVDDGPGRFVIVGVDRETKMDTTWHTEASSPANAKVKAELEGIVVTAVRREG